MRPGGRVSFLSIGAGSSLRGELDKLSRHPDAPVLPTLSANTAAHICRIGSVLEVVPARCHQATSSAAAHSGSVLASPHT
jgi:hypothetical protein